MTSEEDKDLKKPVTHKELLKSMQELSLTLKALKVLADDLKSKSVLASSAIDQSTKKPSSITTDNNAEPNTTIH